MSVAAPTIQEPVVLPLRSRVEAALACPHCHGAINLLRCDVCGYVLGMRNGVLEAIESHAGSRFGNYSFDTNLPQYVGSELIEHDYYLRFLPDKARLIVDCGGGDANASARWARLHPSADLVVADMDGFALQKAAHRGLPNLTALRVPVQSLPLASHSVDAVFSTFMVEHLYDWELSSFYIEARRLLRPGGHLIIQSDAPLFDKFIHPMLRLIKGKGWRTSHFLQRWDTGVRAVHHHNLKTAREQRSFIERHGFFVQGVETPMLFSNRAAIAAVYEAMAGLIPMAWIERCFATSYTIVAVIPNEQPAWDPPMSPSAPANTKPPVRSRPR